MGDNKGHVDRSGMCSLSQAQCTTKEAPRAKRAMKGQATSKQAVISRKTAKNSRNPSSNRSEMLSDGSGGPNTSRANTNERRRSGRNMKKNWRKWGMNGRESG